MTRRRAFTLIELLVVVGILMLLIGIAGYALSRVMGGSQVGSTKVRLEALKSMIGEMEAATKGLNRPIPNMWDGSGTGGTYGTQQYWRDGNPNDTNTPPEPDPFPGPNGDLSLASSGSGTPPRYNADAILNTQQIIGLLQQVPVAKSGLDKLQASEMMETLPAGLTGVRMTVRNATGVTVPYSGAAASPWPPIPLDAWGNPIIFVPGGGLQVAVSGDGSSSGGTPKLLPTTVKGRDLRGFWASAGPDGAFNRLPGNDGAFNTADDIPAGDDNVYSFEN